MACVATLRITCVGICDARKISSVFASAFHHTLQFRRHLIVQKLLYNLYLHIILQARMSSQIAHTHFIIIIIIIKKDWQCKAGRERLTPYQSEDHNPTLPA